MKLFFILLLATTIHGMRADEDQPYVINTAHIRFKSDNSSFAYYYHSANCHNCLDRILQLSPELGPYMPFGMEFDYIFKKDEKTAEKDAYHLSFDEYGMYTVTLSLDKEPIVTVDRKGHNYNIPLYSMIGITLLFIGIVIWIQQIKKRREEKKQKEAEKTAPLIASSTSTVKSTRVASVDVFRGMDLIVMIFANYGAGQYYRTLVHATWDGITLADFAFPTFIFIQGISLRLSIQSGFNRLVKSGKSGSKATFYLLMKALKRALILYVLNFLINTSDSFKTFRILGVMAYFAASGFMNALVLLYMPVVHKRSNAQMIWNGIISVLLCASLTTTAVTIVTGPRLLSIISICVVAALLVLMFLLHKPLGLLSRWEARKDYSEHPDVVAVYDYVIPFACAASHFCIAIFASAGDCPAGYSGPGGISDNLKYIDCTGGIYRKIDVKLLGEEHIYHGAAVTYVYQGQNFECEGIMGMLNAIFMTYLGTWVSWIFKNLKDKKKCFYTYISVGTGLLLIGGVLCGFRQFDGFMPVNKNKWNTSFIAVTSGTAFIVYGVIYMLVDVWKIWSGYPYIALGTNSILIYVVHEFVHGYIPFTYNFEKVSHWTTMINSYVLGCGMWIIIGNALVRQNVAFKIWLCLLPNKHNSHRFLSYWTRSPHFRLSIPHCPRSHLNRWSW